MALGYVKYEIRNKCFGNHQVAKLEGNDSNTSLSHKLLSLFVKCGALICGLAFLLIIN